MVDKKGVKKADKKEDDLKKQVFEMYTPLSVAKEEIWRRWNDKKLRKKVEDFLGGDLPEVFRDKPKATQFRFIATPNFEFQLALDNAKMLNLEMVFMEFLSDKFCTRNSDKVHLGKIVMFHEKKGRDQDIVSRNRIIDLEKCDNRPFKRIRTKSGEGLIEFHHRFFLERYDDIKTFDVSNFRKNERSILEVYLKVLSLFVCNGVLFENYLVNSNEDEKKFTFRVVLPAFNKIYKIFGVKPLIVPLVSYKEDGDIYWQYYLDDLVKETKQNTK